ncbi:MAG: hypothetical protein IOC82_07635 [Aestuariivirga sp.]|uniref:hypothetical protein n=1 Tax=Aestuariivirga sp. TaxID=2650926 RepID=UPI0025BB2FC7|nr:hypothetical protein [Aestuariivirga sp.]MCA3560886.1 hypothetical protein [Aestuariivirga sp.]
MKGSLAASITFHAAILAAALVVLPKPRYDTPPVEAINVDISTISIADANKLKATAPDAPAKLEKPAPKKAGIVKKTDQTLKIADKEVTAAKQAQPEPPPEAKPVPPKEPPKAEQPPPDTTALAEITKQIEDTAPQPPKPAPPKPAVKPPEKPKKAVKLDTAKLEALLNKENEEKTTNASDATADGQPSKGEKNLQGKDQTLSATAIAAFAQRIRECWIIPPGAREGNITVKVHIMLNEDGSVNGQPEIMNGPGDYLFSTTAQSTLTAILQCQNYDFLPKDQYDVWKDLVLNFNPNMFADTATQ